MIKKQILIFGASGFGREVAWLIKQLSDWEVSGFIDDNDDVQNKMINGYPVLGNSDTLLQMNDVNVVIAIGHSSIRSKIINKLKANPSLHFPNILDKDIIIDETVSLGKGNIICKNSVLTTNIVLGDFNIVNLNCTIGHDAVIHDFVTLNPAVNVSGNVTIGNTVNIGTGTQIIQGKTITDDCILGAGSVVVKDLKEKGTYIGVPAVKLSKD